MKLNTRKVSSEILIKEVALDDFIRDCDKQLQKEMDLLWAKSIGLQPIYYGNDKEPNTFHESSMFFHLMKDETAIGFATCTPGELKGSVWLSSIFILPAYRNKGYGPKFMEHLKRTMQEKDYKVFALSYISDNKPAKKLYEMVGFHKQISETLMMKL